MGVGVDGVYRMTAGTEAERANRDPCLEPEVDGRNRSREVERRGP